MKKQILQAVFLGIITHGSIFGILPVFMIWLNDALQFGQLSQLGEISLLTNILGGILIILGIGIFILCTNIFSALGKGTPAPIQPPKKLVIRGLYTYTRNPIYWAYFTIVLGEFFIWGRWLLLLYFFLFVSFVNWYVIVFEEKKLEERFGKSYREYCRRVPRWIWGLKREV